MMSDTRRSFFKVGTALATGLGAAAANLGSAAASDQKPSQPAPPISPVQTPKMKFGNVEISRLVLGTNPFYGFSHYSGNLDHAMREWYTPAKICEIMRRAGQY